MTEPEDENENVELGYNVETRSAVLEFRESEEDGYLEGIAVPYGQVANIGGKFQERFEAGSVEPEETVWLYRDHKTPIGHVIEAEHRAEGLWIRAKLALSDLAKDTLTLLRNGALNSLSVGFVPQETRDEDGVRVVTRARLREVSVVAKPAYSLATVLHVREDTTDREPVAITKENPVSDNTDSAAELATEVRGALEEMEQRLSMLATPAPAVEKVETRSVGQIAQALVANDADTVEYVNEVQSRAYTGGTSADSPIKDAWVGDLTRIFDASSGVLSSIFVSGALPEKGMNVEFAKLASNTVTVEEQLEEGDDLAFGKVTLTTDNAPVKTYGGYTQLTVQEIRRSTLPILDRHFEAMAVAAGKRKKIELRTFFNTVRAAQVTASNTVALGEGLDDVTAVQWADLIVDAAIKYEAKNADFDALVVSPAVFKHLNTLTMSGDKVFKVADANTLGTLNIRGLTGNLAGVPVVCDTGATGSLATFINGRAIRQFNNGIVNLQDDNIINLTKTFSVYYFEALADEQPDLIVPVVIPAAD
jgi:HK97 family phage prohead protease